MTLNQDKLITNLRAANFWNYTPLCSYYKSNISTYSYGACSIEFYISSSCPQLLEYFKRDARIVMPKEISGKSIPNLILNCSQISGCVFLVDVWIWTPFVSQVRHWRLRFMESKNVRYPLKWAFGADGTLGCNKKTN